MAKLLFFSQRVIDSWTEGEKISIEGHTLTLKTAPEGPKVFQLEEAVRFLTVSGGGSDPHGLLGKVKTKKQLDAMSAEAYMESVILGDTPYDVETGYLGRPEQPAGAPAAAAPPPPTAEEEKLDESQVAPDASTSDEDLLASFLLKNMS